MQRVRLAFLDPVFQECLEELYSAREEFNLATLADNQHRVDAAIYRISAAEARLRARLSELRRQWERAGAGTS